MQRSLETVRAIKSLGYPGGSCLSRCECDELPCPLLTWITAHLRKLCPELQDSGGAADVLLVGDLRNLLSLMSCSIIGLDADVMEPSVLNKITDFLVSELQASVIIKHKELNPEEKATEGESEKEQRVQEDGEVTEFCPEYKNVDDSDENRRKAEMQAEWVLVLHSLNMDTTSQFADVLSEVESRLTLLPHGATMNPLLNTSPDSEQWMKVEQMNQTLSADYQCRKQMMIKRFQVTLESFAWGDKQKERSKALDSVPPLASLAGFSQVSLSLLLAAREDQSYIEPIRAGKSTPIYQVLMGVVPDRGGRPGEIEPPMPTWQDRKASGHRSGRGNQKWRQFSDKKKGKKALICLSMQLCSLL
ncbi:protein FAM98C [Sphaeramia orbicularis]|uniref:Protein FAM98C-like n=1 Tax=Sphaeramia orbicularis TaxID=375764 RepID=A0A672ZI16_9TELE|nr:protein FAM98C-like [Sphaeramia orbicularis]